MVDKAVVWKPDGRALNLSALMELAGVDSFEALHAWSVSDPELFWRATMERLDIQFHKPYRMLLDVSAGVAQPRWLVDAKMNIAQSCFRGDLNRPAIITKRVDGSLDQFSFAELDRLSNRVAASLVAMGLEKGDAVAIDMMMTAEAVAIYLGVIKAGMAVVSIPDSFPEGEIAKRLRLGQAKAIFTQDVMPRGSKQLPMYEKVKAAAGGVPVIVLPASGALALPLAVGDQSWQDFLVEVEWFEVASCDPDEVINIIFSSGTTGDPKAIPWMHYTPIKCGSDAMYHHNITADDVVCWPTSLGWMMGPWLIFASFLNGAPIALYEGSPVERDFCEFMVEAKVSMMGLVPSIAKAWRTSGCAEGLDFSAITRYSSSGEASNAEDYAWLMQLNQPGGKVVPVVEYCGGTEIAGGYLSNNLFKANRPAQFNGKALGSDFVLLGEDAEEAEIGEAGELFLLPPAIGLSTRILNRDNTKEYYEGCPAYEGKVLRRHGDRIIRLADGYFCSDGRADNAMNLGGIKIGSAEIERAVSGVDGVIETAAIGIPPQGGGPDQLVMFVVAAGSPDAAALKQALTQAIKTNLNPLFKPHDVVITKELPRTASGKVMHKDLRQQYQEAR